MLQFLFCGATRCLCVLESDTVVEDAIIFRCFYRGNSPVLLHSLRNFFWQIVHVYALKEDACASALFLLLSLLLARVDYLVNSIYVFSIRWGNFVVQR